MASAALTTVFTPPASCFNNDYTLYAASVWEKDYSVTSTECYPSSFHSLWVVGSPYSPGVCPESYTTATVSAYTANTGATAALCCPTGFANHDDGLGCYSAVTAPTVLAAPTGDVTVSSGAILAFHGIYIAWQSGDSVEASATSSVATAQTSIVSSTSTVVIVSSPSTALSTQSSSTSTASPAGAVTPTIFVTSTQSTNTPTTTPTSTPTTSTTTDVAVSAASSPPGTGLASDATTVFITSSPTPVPPPHQLSTGAKAGVGVGVAAAGLGLAAVLAWILFARRRRHRSLPSGEVTEHFGDNSPDMAVAANEYKRHISELSSEAMSPELHGGSSPVEADSRMVRAELEGQ